MVKNKQIQNLLAITLIDGRNRDKLNGLHKFFSEFALIKYRVLIEIKYLIFLSEQTSIVGKLSAKEKNILNKTYQNFTVNEAVIVKNIEKEINHDVKAVEYYLIQKLKSTSLKDTIPFIHFGLTSYDINTPAYALMLKDFTGQILLPKFKVILSELKKVIMMCQGKVMLGRTHGQPALPTTMAKELAVFLSRLQKESKNLQLIKFEAKFTGAIGNFNALSFVCPEYDWLTLSRKFMTSLGLIPNIVTTQIMPYDSWLIFFDLVKRINYILLNLVQDMWWYISLEYFNQKKKEREVGSSTLAHKINPITFENAEGNLQLANSMLEFFVRKLSVSRLQRDLTDSTIKRDFGNAFGFTILAWDSLTNGLNSININEGKMLQDLDNHWEIFSEAIQTYLRSIGQSDAYELIKDKTRGKILSKVQMHNLIDKLPLNLLQKKYLKIKDLSQYKGLADKITKIVLDGE